MPENIKVTLDETLKKCVPFSIAVDISTDVTDTAQLAIFIQAIEHN